MTASPSRLRYAILGTGALGGYYGISLAAAGCDVQFVVRSDFDHVRQHGLKLDTPGKTIHLSSVKVASNTSQLTPFDVLIIATKTTGNHHLIEQIKACPGSPTLVVLQNGIGFEQELESIFGLGRVLGGCCFLCSNKVGPGHIQHLDKGHITLGWPADQSTAAAADRELPSHIAADFGIAGIKVQVIPDLLLARWQKLMWNIPYNGLSVILNASTAELMKNDNSVRLVREVMHDVRMGAEACGKLIPASFAEALMEQTRSMVPYDSSMRLDFRAGRPLEIDAIYGRPLRAAADAGYRMKFVEMLHEQLSYLQNKHCK
jgi:2-dehydropantoate 2-reductase